MVQRVDVKSLSPSTITRARGEEAFKKLRELLERGAVELQLDSVDLLSMSFLDEIVRLLASRRQTEQVTFVTDDPATMDKLERIAAVRSADICVRPGHK